MPRQIDHGKQQIADLVGHGFGIVFRHGFEHFIELFTHFIEHRQGVRPVKADLPRAFLQFCRTRQRRQCSRDVIEQRQLFGCRRFLRALFGLDLFPALLDLLFAQARNIQRRIQVTGGEHVGMTADQFAGDAVDYADEFEAPFFASQLAVIHHLEQQIAQLTLQVIEVTALDRVGDFVGFLKGVRDDGGVRLLDVPRATVLRVAQAVHQV
ncbi:hypothetical protein D3C75_805970 [compost metagenome]